VCGRYYVATEDEDIEIRAIIDEVNRKFYGSPELINMKIGEIYPTNIAPVMTTEGPTVMKWGYPKWKGSGVVINARSETAAEKSMFRSSLSCRRCVVPSSGFYEWTHDSGPKEKYLLQVPSSSTLYMAGIYNTFRDEHGVQYSAYVILTTAANESVATLHDRMPVILRPGEMDAWLHDDAATQNLISRMGPNLDLRKAG